MRTRTNARIDVPDRRRSSRRCADAATPPHQSQHRPVCARVSVHAHVHARVRTLT